MYKIIGADGREYGPVSAAALRQWIAEGRADAQTRVLAEGSTEWKPLASFPEFGLSAAGGPRFEPVPAPFPTSLPPKNNSLAVAGLVLGIISVTCGWCCCWGLPFSVVGLIFCVVALSQIRADPLRQQGRGLAIAGLVLCLLSLIGSALFFAFGLAGNIPEAARSRIHRL
jgi:hypothetical protein